MYLKMFANLGLDLHEGSCFSSSKFLIGRVLFVLVLHVGLFAFAFFSKSRFRLKFPWSPRFVPKHIYKLAI